MPPPDTAASQAALQKLIKTVRDMQARYSTLMKQGKVPSAQEGTESKIEGVQASIPHQGATTPSSHIQQKEAHSDKNGKDRKRKGLSGGEKKRKRKKSGFLDRGDKGKRKRY